MFAAGVLVARWVWDVGNYIAHWIAWKGLMLLIMAFVLPSVFRKAIEWGFAYVTTYSSEMATTATSTFSTMINNLISTNLGVDWNINISLVGVGGFLAIHTGVLDYISIITSGWALAWGASMVTGGLGRLMWGRGF